MRTILLKEAFSFVLTISVKVRGRRKWFIVLSDLLLMHVTER